MYSVSQTAPVALKKSFWRRICEQRELTLLAIPFIAYFLIIYYVPLLGWVMAFQNFRPVPNRTGQLQLSVFWTQTWVGLDNFKFLFSSQQFANILRNTVCMSVISMVVCTFSSIALAIMINELRVKSFKRLVQTLSYLPHFLSWIIACTLISNMLSLDGVINRLFQTLGLINKPVVWLGQAESFWAINTVSQLWKSIGWSSIIYLSAITAIDPGIYEAAQIDGASRFQRIRYITLPGISTTILMLMIIKIGSIMRLGFDVPYLLGNGLNAAYSETIDTYVLKYGIGIGNYSLATATGMFKSVICIVMMFAANRASNRLFGERLI